MRNLAFIFAWAGLVLPAAAQTTHTVSVGPNMTNTFSPKNLTIQVGDTVQWVWAGGIHNVVSNDGYFTSGGLVGPPNTYSLTFDNAFLSVAPISGNVYGYQCALHGPMGMTGTVTVTTPGKPVLTVTDPSPGGSVTITTSAVTPGGNVVTGYSMNGRGPVNTVFGPALLTPPINQLPPKAANAAGVATLNLPVPANVPVGTQVWLQSVDLSAGILSNGVRVTV